MHTYSAGATLGEKEVSVSFPHDAENVTFGGKELFNGRFFPPKVAVSESCEGEAESIFPPKVML